MLKLMIVDDSRIFRHQMKRYLKDSDYSDTFTIYEAANGVEALSILKEHPDINVMTIDVDMPKMSGMELLQEIKFLDEQY